MTPHWLHGSAAGLPVEGELPGFEGATGWLNSPPLTRHELHGRVVLVNFWTYTCVNWLRQLPYVRAWAAKYASKRLVVVGVHTPEFGFEHDPGNVRREAQGDAVGYPVALDNDYAVWRAFDNHYWPALYLADGQGRIRYHHFGEGEYARTEMAIQRLVDDPDRTVVSVEPRPVEVAADWSTLRSPENYTGYERAERFASPDGFFPGKPHRYDAPDRLRLNEWALAGDWTVGEQATVATAAGGRILNRFHARDLNLVMGAPGPVRFQLLLDGRPPGTAAGADIDPDGYGEIGDRRLYQLVRQSDVADRTAEITFLDPGAETYSFTFG
ncbi:redoxin domain-containing protein [Actinoplanes sp. KI2]|uniref:redoxin domain-containing protein n=1 Tax=Actinoplanes sp. KI2 TaxID=2983315 RepID=UPI0021D5C5CE|nr:redoxin domain-containing protein [Actinoplanes sp. KI2]MCU7726357.1 redoxin domain-containing protein [Actinoplanes sp. KI2]